MLCLFDEGMPVCYNSKSIEIAVEVVIKSVDPSVKGGTQRTLENKQIELAKETKKGLGNTGECVKLEIYLHLSALYRQLKFVYY